MRKEVKLGMTIGGGVLAVIIGYLVLNTKGGSKHPVDTLATSPDLPGNNEQPGQSTEGGAPLVTSGSPTTEKPTKLLRTIDKNDPWSDKLYGKADRTVTPDPNNPIASGPNGLPDGGIPGGGEPSRVAKFGKPDGAIPAGESGALVDGGKARTHKVQKGETFSTIAATYYGSSKLFRVIVNANPRVDPTRLKPGMEINLPDPAEVRTAVKTAGNGADKLMTTRKIETPLDSKTEYRVQAGDNLNRISMKIYGRVDMVQKIYEANKALIGGDPAKLKLNMVLKLPQAVASTN